MLRPSGMARPERGSDRVRAERTKQMKKKKIAQRFLFLLCAFSYLIPYVLVRLLVEFFCAMLCCAMWVCRCCCFFFFSSFFITSFHSLIIIVYRYEYCSRSVCNMTCLQCDVMLKWCCCCLLWLYFPHFLIHDSPSSRIACCCCLFASDFLSLVVLHCTLHTVLAISSSSSSSARLFRSQLYRCTK